jgi:hypothetical protein
MTALKDCPRTEPEILIEEARQRTRERRRRGAALVAGEHTASTVASFETRRS